MTRRSPTASSTPTAGQRLIAELSKPDDPYSLQFLIEQAGHTADYLERLSALLSGDVDSWLQVKIGAKTVEVIVSNPLVQHRQFSDHLRKLIAEVARQRAAIPADPDDNDDLAGLT